MRASARVVLDSLDLVLAGRVASEIHDPDSPFVPAAAVPDSDLARVVPAADAVAFSWVCQGDVGSPFPEMVVDGSHQVPDAGCSGLVSAELDVGFFLGYGPFGKAGVELR